MRRGKPGIFSQLYFLFPRAVITTRTIIPVIPSAPAVVTARGWREGEGRRLWRDEDGLLHRPPAWWRMPVTYPARMTQIPGDSCWSHCTSPVTPSWAALWEHPPNFHFKSAYLGGKNWYTHQKEGEQHLWGCATEGTCPLRLTASSVLPLCYPPRGGLGSGRLMVWLDDSNQDDSMILPHGSSVDFPKSDFPTRGWQSPAFSPGCWRSCFVWPDPLSLKPDRLILVRTETWLLIIAGVRNCICHYFALSL